jgi:ferritin-like metal-binding protein YciE
LEENECAQKIATLEQAFVEEIRDLYDAEKQLTRALPKMAKASSSEELRNAFREHLEVTKGQVERLEQVFQMLDQKARSKPCKGMKGLIEEGQEQNEANAEPNVKDVSLIGAAQKVEHCEISGYGTVRTMAQQLNRKDVANLLEETLKEEEQPTRSSRRLPKDFVRRASGRSGAPAWTPAAAQDRLPAAGCPLGTAARRKARRP